MPESRPFQRLYDGSDRYVKTDPFDLPENVTMNFTDEEEQQIQAVYARFLLAYTQVNGSVPLPPDNKEFHQFIFSMFRSAYTSGIAYSGYYLSGRPTPPDPSSN